MGEKLSNGNQSLYSGSVSWRSRTTGKLVVCRCICKFILQNKKATMENDKNDKNVMGEEVDFSEEF